MYKYNAKSQPSHLKNIIIQSCKDLPQQFTNSLQEHQPYRTVKMNEENVELQSLTMNSSSPNSINRQNVGRLSPTIIPISFKGPRTNTSRKRCSITFYIKALSVLIGFLLLSWSMISFDGSGLGSVDISMTTSNSMNDDDYTPKCQLLPEEKGPLPVIIMAVGRTGSSITWDTVARMTGHHSKAWEITGGNKEKSVAFFDDINPAVGKHWASESICEIQRLRAKEIQSKGIGIAGFQWKPYRPSLRHEFGEGALSEIASHSHPMIKVIYLTRNPLDRLLSNRKHKNYQHSEEVPAHCAIDDEECIKHHKQHQSAIVLPTGKELLKILESGLVLDKMVEEYLDNYGVKYVHVTYDKLYISSNADEWSRIFRFLGRGPQGDLTMEEVMENFDLAPTSSKSHKDIIANFDEVWDTLKGTKYEYLVH